MQQYLSIRDEQILKNFPASYRDLAMAAIRCDKAFCPSCYFARSSNCAHFDECDIIEPKRP